MSTGPKLYQNHHFTPTERLEWHYKRARSREREPSDDRLADAFRMRDVEVTAAVKEGALADGVCDAIGVNESVGDVGLSGLGASDEYKATVRGRGTHFNPENMIMALHFVSLNPDPLESTVYRQAWSKISLKFAR